MVLRDVSPAEVARQVRRDGARHGLRPVIRHGACHVAQREAFVTEGFPVAVAGERWEPFMDVDVDHPLSNIWRQRKQRHQHRMTPLLMERHAREQELRDIELADLRRQRRKELDHVVRQTGLDAFWQAVAEVHGGKRNAG